MSWKAPGELAARLYSMGLTFPSPEPFPAAMLACRMSAKIPANDGDPAEVPPIAVRVLSLALNPLVQLLGIGGGKPT
jgi:hypothetical protein